MSACEPQSVARRSRQLWIKWIVRLVVLVLVTWGIWSTVAGARDKFAEKQFDWTAVRVPWLLLAGVFYAAGSLPMWRFWHGILWAMGQRPAWWETLPAFYIGHLGKYVPGKAMVVYLRTALIRSERVDTVVAATSVFIETLTMMAVGACVSAVILLFYSQHWLLMLLAIGLMLGAGIPSLPPVFRRVVRLLQLRRLSGQAEDSLAALTVGRLVRGWLGISCGWALMGLSLWATLQALPQRLSLAASLADWPLLTACVGLALVAGFLSLLPGGILVREYVVMALLASDPQYGPQVAIVSAVLLRIVWLLSELFVSGILYGLLIWKRSPASARA